ncbi:MAG: hypothetical protein HY719_01905 [Planctomycetes bacterium]|nr:hypothetical protein [Planctomycetota bacterium]
MADVAGLIAKAQEAKKRRNWPYAVQLLQQAILADPDSPEARREMRDVQRQRTLDGQKPSKLKATALKGKVFYYEKRKDWEACDNECERCLDLSPDDIEVLITSGRALAERGLFRAAAAQFEHALTLDPRHVKALKQFGFALMKEKDFRRADEMIQRAAKLAPSDHEIFDAGKRISAELSLQAGWDSNKGAVELLRDVEKTRELVKQAADVLDVQRIGDNIKALENSLTGDPGDVKALRRLIELCEAAGDAAKAQEYVERLIKWEPENFDLTVKQGDIKVRQYEAYLAQIDQNLRSDPESAEWREKRKEARTKILKFKIREWERRAEHYPNDSKIRFDLGCMFMEGKLWDRAVKELQAARREPRFQIDAETRLGEVFFQQGRHSMALKQFEKVRELIGAGALDVRTKDVVYWMVRCHQALGTYQQGYDLAETIFLEDAEYRDIADLLSTLDKLRKGEKPGAPGGDDLDNLRVD